MKDNVNYLAVKDTVFNGFIALPVIMVFEIYMIITWCINMSDAANIQTSKYYLIGYILLLLVSGVVLISIFRVRNKLEENVSWIMILQNSYSVFLVLWSIVFTYIGGVLRGNFSVLLFMTIVTVVPLFTFIQPWLTGTVNLLAGVYVIIIAIQSNEDHLSAFITNFAVFMIISTVASMSFYKVRKNGYSRQLELEKISAEAHAQAYRDGLTELYNRRSYNEDIDQMLEKAIPEDLIIGSFDLNNLKTANDNFGHQAGDELIKATAAVLLDAFERFGKVYRVGGDEFCTVMRTDRANLDEAVEKFEKYMKAWRGKYTGTLSISYGFGVIAEMEGCSFREVEMAADTAMYDMKKKYHEQKGDR